MAAASQKRVSCLKFEPWSQIFLVKVAYQATFTHTTMKSHLLLKVLKVVRKQWDFSNSSKVRGWAKSLKNRRKHVLILRQSKSRRAFLLEFVKKSNLNGTL